MARKSKSELISVPEQGLTLAEELYAIEYRIAGLEERKDAIREQLMQNLKEQGVKSVRLENGDMYIRAERMKLVIKDERKAMQWALENPEARMKLDTSAALTVARMGEKCFGVGSTEYLTIKRHKPNQDTNQEVDGG
jgi:hypothetical protein